MKFLASLTLMALSFSFSYSQEVQTVLKKNITIEKPIKKIEGTTWVHPLNSKRINIKSLSDTIELDIPKAARFYPDILTLTSHSYNIDILKYNNVPTVVDLTEQIQPFYIKNFEVTNGEYKAFLEQQTVENQGLLYPDTMVWITDFGFSYNDPMTRVYFYHSKY
ncbi:MAG: hypothetical protein ACI9UJ_001503, partial [bacterium]